MNDYYNTTGYGGDELNRRRGNARTQTLAILKLYYMNRGRGHTPREVHKLLGGDDFGDINSVRRAITNMTDAGQLRKTGDKRKGDKGANELVWEFVKKKPNEKVKLATCCELVDWAAGALAVLVEELEKGEVRTELFGIVSALHDRELPEEES
jgi:hypothetical protein